jgi:outer membrane phospholipase A
VFVAGIMHIPLLLASVAAVPAGAAMPVPLHYLVDAVQPGAGDRLMVDLVALNGGDWAVTALLPRVVEGVLDIGGVGYPVRLESVSGGEAAVPARGFVRTRYALHASRPLPATFTGRLTVSELGLSGAALALAGGPVMAQAQTGAVPARTDPTPPVEPATVALPPTEVASATPPSVSRGNFFLGNLSAYQPIYAVYGPGTNSDARLQISFQYQLFGDPATPADERGLLDGLRFAYTQRMFWDLGADSSPFRNIDYMPEIFYLAPERRLANGVTIGGQGGFMHQSNGRDGDASRSLNMLYVQPMVTFATGRYRISTGPRGWLYVGNLSDNPDVRRYRGNLGLQANVDRDDGLRLSVSTRSSVQTGRTSVDSELSYPIPALFGGGPNLYLFGQAFAGWGENLLDYRRKQTRLRVGLGIVR